MNMLFITQYYWPETNGAANRLSGLAKELVQLGHHVGVVTAMPNYPTGRIHPEYQKKLLMQEEIEGVKVYRCWLYTSLKKDYWRRLLNYLSFVFTALWQIFRVYRRYDVLVVSSPPLFLGITGLIYHWLLGIPLIFDVRDIWPEVFVEMGELKRNSWSYKLALGLEELIYSKAALVTVVTEGKREALLKRGIVAEKVVCIPNGFDREFLAYPIQHNLRNDLGLNGKFVVLYAGLIGKAQGMETVFQVAARTTQPKLHFLLVGEGVEKAHLIKEAERLGLNNLTFLAGQPRENMLSFLDMADIVLVPLKSSNLRNSVPSKLYEALAAGCSVVLVAEGDSVKLLQEAGSGLAIDPDNLELICSTLENLCTGKLILPRMRGSKSVMENYRRDKIAAKLVTEIAKRFGVNF